MVCGKGEGIGLMSDVNRIGFVCLHLDSTGEAVTQEELKVRRAFLLLAGEASSQVRDDPKWWGFACIYKCLSMSCM